MTFKKIAGKDMIAKGDVSTSLLNRIKLVKEMLPGSNKDIAIRNLFKDAAKEGNSSVLKVSSELGVQAPSRIGRAHVYNPEFPYANFV